LSLRLKVIFAIIGTVAITFIIIVLINIYTNDKSVKEEIDDRELSVKILNGCGVPGLARDYEAYLKDMYNGYENTFFKFSEPSNTRKSIYNKSIIVVSQELDTLQTPNNLEVLIERTGIENWTYAIDKVELPDYQFLIIIGRDFQNIMK
jgi:hypothetical protein